MRRNLLLLLGTILVTDLLATVLYLRHVDASLETARAPERADAAVVFFGDSLDLHTLNEDTKQRVDHAATLFLKQRVTEIVCVGGNLPWLDFAGSELMRARLVEQGVPDEVISTEHDSRDTLGNLQAAAATLSERGRKSAVLVSTRLHLFRIERWSEVKGFTIYLSPSDGEVDLLSRWWPTHHEWAAFTLRTVLSEEGYGEVTEAVRRVGL